MLGRSWLDKGWRCLFCSNYPLTVRGSVIIFAIFGSSSWELIFLLNYILKWKNLNLLGQGMHFPPLFTHQSCESFTKPIHYCLVRCCPFFVDLGDKYPCLLVGVVINLWFFCCSLHLCPVGTIFYILEVYGLGFFCF